MDKGCTLVAIPMLAFLILLSTLGGCATVPRYTEEQWERIKPPETMEASNALANLKTKVKDAEAKFNSAEAMTKVKVACAIGIIGSILAIVLGSGGVKAFGVAGLIACIGGFAFIKADELYGRIIAYIGLAICTGGGGYAVWILVTALKEVVKGGEYFKKAEPVKGLVRFKACHKVSQKHKSTNKMVDKIRNKLINAEAKAEIKRELKNNS